MQLTKAVAVLTVLVALFICPAGTGASPELSGNLSGKVVETMNASGYTYVSLEKDGRKVWVAVPEMKVSVGQEMSFLPGDVMKDFTSKTLNRTFETIIFSAGPATVGSTASPGTVSKGMAPAKIKVDKAEGPDAYTIAELYSKKGALNKKSVAVRGKVVKISVAIMGKNWIHLQDGTGSAKKGTNNLVVTTQDSAAVGDIVTARGTLSKNKDFGEGYKYDAIVEDAVIRQ